MNIFIFHRDLRINDNTTLIKQIKECGNIIPIFIFTNDQILKTNNKYFSNNSVQFMIESLHELADAIKEKNGKLYFFMGDNIKILESIHKEYKINSIGYNIDYTPYAKKRDSEINKWAKDNDINIYCEEDYALYNLLNNETINQTTKNAYLVYTPFKKYCMKNLIVRKPDKFNSFHFYKKDEVNNSKYYMKRKEINKFYTINENINVRGGRKNGLKILSNINNWDHYNKERDTLTYKTTFLGAHNHFSTVSIREVYHNILDKLGKSNGLINELHWRDFYINITYFYPKILQKQIKQSSKNKALKEKYDDIKWSYNKKLFKLWSLGQTGFPIIDAAMNQLNNTGFMHNRCRMIVASFLCKDLHIDWRLGEQYFATKLVDYDPMSNSGGWQWSASTGADSQPYFRIFNPWSQQIKFDKDCEYIKKWLPELSSVPTKDIHNWFDTWKNYKDIKYYKPIIDHSKEKDKTLQIFKAVL
jgi:deoxyribodipyrimidine photo-lyase